ncbi:hypothetical protein JCM8097_007684 [Rhodosporidiobolus ruineniae]
MSYSANFTHDPAAYELQNRYSRQFAEHPATDSPPSAGSSHNRYSSADLYKLNSPPATSPPTSAGPRSSGSALLGGTWNDDSSDDEDGNANGSGSDDDGPGFASYAEGQRDRRRSSTANLSQAGQMRRGSSRMSVQAPPLVSSLSSHSTLPPQAHLSHAYHPSTASFGGQSPYALPYSAVPQSGYRHSSTTSFFTGHKDAGSLYTPPAQSATDHSHTAVGGDWVENPVLAKEDWGRGEGIREKAVYKSDKAREKKDQAVGGVVGVWRWIRRRWMWTLPLFILICVAAIVLCYFLIPRTPTITFTSPKVPENPFTSADDSPYVSSKDPTAFSFDASLSFAIDASASYLPVTYRSFGLTVKLSDTGGTVAHTVWDAREIKVAARGETSYEQFVFMLLTLALVAFQFPITFSGNYSNSDDRTYQAIRSACQRKYATIYRPPLNFTVEVESSILGVVSPPKRTAMLRGVDCPVEWAANAS